MNNRLIGLIAVLALASAGCTQPTTSPAPTLSGTSTNATSQSATPAASPTPTWSEGQAAAIAAVDGYSRSSALVGADPSKFTEAQMNAEFKKYLGTDMLAANVASFMRLRKNDWHYQGDVVVQSLKATKVVDNHNERGLEVHVTTCRDQSAVEVVDQYGKTANTEQPPKFNLRQYSVRKPTNSTTWRVYGIQTVQGKCGP